MLASIGDRSRRRRAVGVAAVILVATGLVGCAAEDGPVSGGDRTAGAPAASPTARPHTAPEPRAGDQTVYLDWGGEERSYELHVPSGLSSAEPLPLVIAMHPRGGDAALMRRLTGLDALADSAGFLVAYPYGRSGAMNALVCCGSNDDVGFVRTMLDQLNAVWRIDAARVYATGISNGADMSYRLAIELPGTFAAIAPVSGGYIGYQARTDPAFKPATPVSVISFVGEKDRAVGRFRDGLDTWYRKLGCDPDRARSADQAGTVTVVAADCADGSTVVAYSLAEMGHAWPGGGTGSFGAPSAPVSATELMWTFFTDHPRTR